MNLLIGRTAWLLRNKKETETERERERERESETERKRELSRMTYRPIGIVLLRNYGWELSNHLRVPSRQVERFGKKGRVPPTETEHASMWRAGDNQRKPIHPGARKVAAGTLYPEE